jgi:hypothetical protein
LPHIPDNVAPVSEVASVKVDQSVIGSCTNGRIEDLRTAAEVLKGKTIHPDVRCIIIPGSQQVYLDAMHEGLVDIFVRRPAAHVSADIWAYWGLGKNALLQPIVIFGAAWVARNPKSICQAPPWLQQAH